MTSVNRESMTCAPAHVQTPCDRQDGVPRRRELHVSPTLTPESCVISGLDSGPWAGADMRDSLSALPAWGAFVPLQHVQISAMAFRGLVASFPVSLCLSRYPGKSVA